MRWLERVLLLFHLNSQTDGREIEFIFLQYMECPHALDEAGKELGRVCLGWSTTKEINHGKAARKELDNRTELNAGAWFVVDPFSTFRCDVHVVHGSYEIPPPSRPFRGRIIFPT